MTRDEAAAAMNGREYTEEGTREFFAGLKAAGLVAVFGASDDLMEFRGAIDDEVGAYNGTTELVDREGLLPDRESIEDDGELAAFFRRKPLASKIKAIWCPKDEAVSWAYKTKIPHATFNICEDDEVYCRGIVFALADLPA
jgi:hypothetical protein